MITRDRYPHGVPSWIDTEQPDPKAAAAFYGRLFGWEFTLPEPGYHVARLHGRDVAGIGTGAADAPTLWNTYVDVDSADEVAVRAEAAGGRILADPADVRGAGRAAVLADPTGAVLRVWQAGTHHGAQLVNHPGTWNFSDLRTPDPRTATAFYGSVFGWVAEQVDFGTGPVTMWRVPGYGDHLATLDPTLRERHASHGVPPGFSDAIGWMNHGDPPAWEVTFAVDGTDAVADLAVELGGEVVTAPFDGGPTRVAVLRDPHGATFAVTTYTPQ